MESLVALKLLFFLYLQRDEKECIEVIHSHVILVLKKLKLLLITVHTEEAAERK